jgi:endonuclease III
MSLSFREDPVMMEMGKKLRIKTQTPEEASSLALQQIDAATRGMSFVNQKGERLLW